MVASVSQYRGVGSKATALQTLDVITARDDAHFGAAEYAHQAFEPAVVGVDYTHLSSEGYYRLGRQIGDRIYDVLAGAENRPILIDDVVYVVPNEVIVTFSGVETFLVDDPSIYRANAGFSAPRRCGSGSIRRLQKNIGSILAEPART